MSALTVARLEWRRLFITPFGWLALAFTLGLLGWDFLTRLEVWMAAQDAETLAGATLTDRVLMPVVAQAAQLTLVLAAILSLRAFSDDRRQGTDALLLSAPISRWSLSLGKHAGLWCLPLLLALAPLLMALTLLGGTDPDWGRLFAVIVGLTGLALTATAIALALSVASSQPALGAILSFAVLLGLWLADFAPRSRGVLDSPLAAIALGAQFRPFLAGLVSSAALVYFVAITLGALALTANAVRPASRRRRWITSTVVMLSVLALLALGNATDRRWDWTHASNHTLSPSSIQLLDRIQGPMSATVFASADRRLRQSIDHFLDRYRRHKSDIKVVYRDPAVEPELVRQFDLRTDGEIDLQIGDRHERLRRLSETEVAHALQRLARPTDHLVAYTWGSGERDLRGATPFDMGRFGEALTQRGIQTLQLDLLINPIVPGNLDLLIITQPRQALLAGVVESIASYVANGGNVLWLSDPGGLTGLEPLAEAFEILPLDGVVLDARASNYGIDNPRFAVVSEYPDHPITREFHSPTIMPLSLAWQLGENSSWQSTPVIRTHQSSWTEIGAIEGKVGFDEGTDEQRGPLDLGLVLERNGQRAVVVGDADFLSNQYVGIGGNLDLGLRLVNWLLADDSLIDIPARIITDGRLELSPRAIGLIGLLWLVVIPGLCLIVGVTIWWKRRRA